MRQWILGLWLGLLGSTPCLALEVMQTLPNGVKVTADYRAAAPGAPAVLILHGFLVNAAFPVVQALAGELSSKGYAVLAPSLSLGVSKRQAGLACDAIHTHTEAEDLAEVQFWIDWLNRQRVGSIVLLGHSFGSVQLLDYVARSPSPQVTGLIGMSMSYVGAAGELLDAAELQQAKARQAQGDRSLGRYQMIYCHGNYTSTAEGYLSYAALQRTAVLGLAERAKIPLMAIMGGGDQRFGADWVQDLQRAGVRVQVVPGATHFFDGTYEFDLLDAVQRDLLALGVRP